ncbi:MAG TPA: PEP-CTERM sorting domain-containing protein [Isosphaeraceae bacterium]|nr:PEP-CTERM sorting domain-containing protein [Isosphaeraceae bacterium]
MKLNRRSAFLGLAVATLGLLALGSSQARATIIPNLDSVINNNNGTFTYNYHADLAADQRVDPAGTKSDFLTIYDFAGLVSGSAHVNQAGWTVSVQNIGITPPSTLPTDDPTIPNITITHSDTVGTITGPQNPLITFSAISSAGPVGIIAFAAQATRSTGPLVGTKIQNVGVVNGPGFVPEPASLALLGIGVPFALTLLRRKKAKAT